MYNPAAAVAILRGNHIAIARHNRTRTDRRRKAQDTLLTDWKQPWECREPGGRRCRVLEQLSV